MLFGCLIMVIRNIITKVQGGVVLCVGVFVAEAVWVYFLLNSSKCHSHVHQVRVSWHGASRGGQLYGHEGIHTYHIYHDWLFWYDLTWPPIPHYPVSSQINSWLILHNLPILTYKSYKLHETHRSKAQIHGALNIYFQNTMERRQGIPSEKKEKKHSCT